MQHLFSRANETLHHELSSYADSLRAVVGTLPQAADLALQVVREARLAEALLAFGSGPQVVDLGQVVFHLSNSWALRDETQARTAGFEHEIAEARSHREQAGRGLQLVARYLDDAIAGELRTCFTNITAYLDAELQLLNECQDRVRPFAANPDLTRKRLNLLIAAAEARLPDTPERRIAVGTYIEAEALLREWEGGVPLDERGIAIIERCLDIINRSSGLFGVIQMPEPNQRTATVVVPEQHVVSSSVHTR
jgi:hypothetical protein